MRQTRAETQQPLTLEKALAIFVNALSGKNRSAATIRAYQTDIRQFISFLHEISVSTAAPQNIEKVDILEYFSFLAKKDLNAWCELAKSLKSKGGFTDTQTESRLVQRITPLFSMTASQQLTPSV